MCTFTTWIPTYCLLLAQALNIALVITCYLDDAEMDSHNSRLCALHGILRFKREMCWDSTLGYVCRPVSRFRDMCLAQAQWAETQRAQWTTPPPPPPATPRVVPPPASPAAPVQREEEPVPAVAPPATPRYVPPRWPTWPRFVPPRTNLAELAALADWPPAAPPQREEEPAAHEEAPVPAAAPPVAAPRKRPRQAPQGPPPKNAAAALVASTASVDREDGVSSPPWRRALGRDARDELMIRKKPQVTGSLTSHAQQWVRFILLQAGWGETHLLSSSLRQMQRGHLICGPLNVRSGSPEDATNLGWGIY